MPFGRGAAGKLSLTANAGAAFHSGLAFHDHYRYEQSSIFGSQDIDANRWSISKNLGCQSKIRGRP